MSEECRYTLVSDVSRVSRVSECRLTPVSKCLASWAQSSTSGLSASLVVFAPPAMRGHVVLCAMVLINAAPYGVPYSRGWFDLSVISADET